MVISKITSKAQTTIPLAVRVALGVGEGDEIAYVIEKDRVILTRPPQRRRDADDPFATFSEWESDADQRTYTKL